MVARSRPVTRPRSDQHYPHCAKGRRSEQPRHYPNKCLVDRPRSPTRREAVQLKTNPLENLALVAPDGGSGLYAVKIAGGGEIHLFRHFSDLVDELVRQLDDGMLLHRIGAHGSYNNNLEELTTGRASFEFRMPTSVQG